MNGAGSRGWASSATSSGYAHEGASKRFEETRLLYEQGGHWYPIAALNAQPTINFGGQGHGEGQASCVAQRDGVA
jgi:hypothetical protein